MTLRPLRPALLLLRPALLLLALLLAGAVEAQAPPLEVTVQANPPRATAPATVNFHAVPLGGQPPFAFAWDLGDGQTSTEQVAPRGFATGGTYVARVTITDGTGARSTAEGVVQVAPELRLVAGSDFAGGKAPVDVTLEASALGGTPPYTFHWDLGSNGGVVAGQVQRVHIVAGCACAFSVQVKDSWDALQSASVHVQTDPPSDGVNAPLFIGLGLVLLVGLAAFRLRRRA